MHWHGYMEQTDYWVLFAVILLSLAGIIMVYSATFHDPSTMAFTYRQLLWTVLGLIWLIIVTGFDYHTWFRYAWWLYALNLLILIAVIVVGRKAGGAARWISIGGFQFQPSEFSKIIIILTLTRYLVDIGDQIRDWKWVAGAFILVGVPISWLRRTL